MQTVVCCIISMEPNQNEKLIYLHIKSSSLIYLFTLYILCHFRPLSLSFTDRHNI